MISPQPPRLRMNRRKTVSVTPAIGASTVAGEMLTDPIRTLEGTTEPALSVSNGWTFVSDQPSTPRSVAALSQNFFTALFYLPGKEVRTLFTLSALIGRSNLSAPP